MRSTMAPEISAAVMIANVPWKHMKSRCGIVPCSDEPDAVQEHARRVADPVVARRERQRVTDDRPEHAHESERDETHHHRVERVLRAHQPAVEERERGRHQQHERRRDQHPCSVGLVHILTSKRTKRMKATARARRRQTSNADRKSAIKISATPADSPRANGCDVSGRKRDPLALRRRPANPATLHFCFPANCARTSLSGSRPTSCPARRCGCCSRARPAARTRGRRRSRRSARPR